IEFDANQLDTAANTTVPCPHCGLETTICLPKPIMPLVSYELANETMDPDVQLEVGLKLLREDSTNKHAGIKMLIGAAEKGSVEAMYNLSVCYEFGHGVEKNHEEANRWCRAAAEQGHAEAAGVLGRAYFLGEGVPENRAEACKWYLKAAKKGLATAQQGLALCYMDGRGVPQNYVEAYKFTILAAARGLEDIIELRDSIKGILSPSQIEEGQLRAEAETRRLEQSAGEENLEAQVRQPIPSAVRREVWRRDQGKCARCGSREKLEYDHIVPVARGGSNTARNIELLCESCNRSKSHSIQ
ncbi:MAG TPA: HNH endonuclease, partial [Candidatus Acidoferrum sp.]|nr:HNH endonuclease [Candidatus Acidoferrum sp.]